MMWTGHPVVHMCPHINAEQRATPDFFRLFADSWKQKNKKRRLGQEAEALDTLVKKVIL